MDFLNLIVDYIHETNEVNLLISANVKFVKLKLHLYRLFDCLNMLRFPIQIMNNVIVSIDCGTKDCVIVSR